MRTTYELPKGIEKDLERLREETERFREGVISEAEYRSFRVPQGVYEQRQSGTYMVRVRLPAGGILPHQMRTLAGVSRTHGNGILHLTTRQDIQVHSVPLEGIYPAMAALYDSGLSAKGGGGNTVRNIISCHDAGVCPVELFDVTPQAVALTEFLLPDPLSLCLPRKYKIAFSGCPVDCAGATVADLGFIAKRQKGEDGFAVYVGGGLGAQSRVGVLLEEFVPVPNVHLIAEAVKRVFDKHGNRKEKNKARLRFLIAHLGLEGFRTRYEGELSDLRRAGLPVLGFRNFPRGGGSPPEAAEEPSAGFDAWRRKNVIPQAQNGYHLVHGPLRLGDIAADDLEGFADAVETHGDGIARITQCQNFVVRWVHTKELPSLHRTLAGLDLTTALAPVLRDLIACAGSSICRLGICLSRGLAQAVTRRLTEEGLDLDKMGKLALNISGCPNSCGRHPVGNIGFFGAARRSDGRLVPHYVVQLGGRMEEGRTRLARGEVAIPARNVPAFTAEFLRAYSRSPHCPDFDAFLEAGGFATAAGLLEKHRSVPTFEEDKNYFYDWGAGELFSLAGRGAGECGAGVFDLIEVDMACGQQALSEGRLFAATVFASRALLVTRAKEARSDVEALELFARFFIAPGLVGESFQGLIEEGRRSASAARPEEAFRADKETVRGLVEAVRDLYRSMDSSLRFRAPEGPGSPVPAPATKSGGEVHMLIGDQKVRVDREEDFRGVVCPLNYVKTKLALEQMKKGEVLSILVDRQGAENVPRSTTQDGHQVLAVKREGERWRAVFRKG